jgi:hypothetical protein
VIIEEFGVGIEKRGTGRSIHIITAVNRRRTDNTMAKRKRIKFELL